MNPKIEELRFRVKNDPKSRLFYPLAEELLKVGGFAEAEEILRAGLAHHPSYLSAWVALGRVLQVQGKKHHAAEALHRALQLDPGNAVASNLLTAVSKDLRVHEQSALRVFLCHGSEDKDAVRKLYHQLAQAGMKPWLDEEDLPPGVEWEPAIKRAVRDSHVILVCLSRNAVSKIGFVQKEIRYALDRAEEMPEGTIYIIPVRLEHCTLPERLAKWQAVDIFSASGADRLMKALRTRAEALSGT
jgi:tetratricopeptide (TPR) repeat protein